MEVTLRIIISGSSFFKEKLNASGEITKIKARLVAGGNHQI
jgi:hypothetical protein